ncbi:homeodomain-interacting protein kinase 1-like isoform 2-T2 [Spinachia spinachia]
MLGLLDIIIDPEKRYFMCTGITMCTRSLGFSLEMANKLLMSSISSNYTILNVLGHGCYGDVLQCLKRDTKEMVAVKVLKQKSSQNSTIQEVTILEKLRCLDPNKSNIVRCHEWFHWEGRTFMVFEMLDMSLFEYMSRREWKPVPLNGIRIIIRDVATALKALKGLGLVHTDLKPDNILLVHHQTKPFRAKVIDFGLTLTTSQTGPQQTVQALGYRSPEIILGLTFNEAIDIWSLGTILAEMLLGFLLFPGTHEYDVLCRGADAAHRSACIDLLKDMLQMAPWSRITPNKILAHPFLTRSDRSTANSCPRQAARTDVKHRPKAEDDRGRVAQPVNHITPGRDLVLESISYTDSASNRASDTGSSSHASEVNEPERKKEEIKLGCTTSLAVQNPNEFSGLFRTATTDKTNFCH